MSTADILRKLKARPLTRTFTLDRAAVNADARTAVLAFASDKPIDHWFGQLRLSMDRKAMRAGRLDSGAPLLLDHDPAKQIGVIENYSLDRGVARATVRFSKSALGEEVFQDVKDGIRKSVSVGFMIHKMDLEKKGSPDVFRSDDWEPFEISLVSIPADISVGVGRSAKLDKQKDKTMRFEANPEDPNSEELQEAAQIRQWGEIFGETDLAANYISRTFIADSRPTVDGFRQLVQAKKVGQARGPQLPPMDPHTAAAREGVPGYELARSVPRYGRIDSFKGERAEEKAFRFGQWLLGNVMGVRSAARWCQEHGLQTRVMTEGVNEAGGFLVPEEFGNDLVDLIERSGVFRRYAKIVPMTSDARTDPAVVGRLESQFVGEFEEIDVQDMSWTRLGLYARKHAVLCRVSSELSDDSSISIADQVAADAARAFAEKEDKCGFIGDAGSTYGGIAGIGEKLKGVDGTIGNIQGLQVGSGNAYSELTLADFRGVVARLPEYADSGATWFMNKRFYWNVVADLLMDAGGLTLADLENRTQQRLFGYPVEFVKEMPSTEANSQVCAILGNLSLGSRFGERRAYDFMVDPYSLFSKDATQLRATARFDINNHGVGDTVNAGPLCGLITAAS